MVPRIKWPDPGFEVILATIERQSFQCRPCAGCQDQCWPNMLAPSALIRARLAYPSTSCFRNPAELAGWAHEPVENETIAWQPLPRKPGPGPLRFRSGCFKSKRKHRGRERGAVRSTFRSGRELHPANTDDQDQLHPSLRMSHIKGLH